MVVARHGDVAAYYGYDLNVEFTETYVQRAVCHLS